MEMCYQGTLAMPKSYAVMDQDEMMYVEGGARFKRSWLALAIDFAFSSAAPLLAPLKYAGRAAAKRIVKKNLSFLAGKMYKWTCAVLGIGINATAGKIGSIVLQNLWCATSLGGIISIVADCASDNKVDGWIRVW